MLTSRLDAYISRYGDFCTNDNDNDNNDDTTDYFTPCACAWGKNTALISDAVRKGYNWGA